MHRKYEPQHHHDHHDDHHGNHHSHEPVLPRLKLRWLLAAGLTAWVATCIYIVQPNEQAVVWRCGQILTKISSPGIHFGLPYGIDRVTKLKTLELKRVGIGLNLDDRNLGRVANPRRAECLTGDRNLIAVSAIVQYDIVNAKDYLTRTADVSVMIEDFATAALSTAIASMTVDDVFTVKRLEIQQKVISQLKDQLAQWEQQGQGLGARINSVTLEEVRPPVDVDQAFRDVLVAREDRQRAINEAEAYANGLLPSARGESQRVRLEAEGVAAEMAQQSRGDSDRFHRMIAELSAGQGLAGRDLTMKRLVIETLEEVLPRMKKIVLDDQAAKQLDMGLIEDQPSPPSRNNNP